MPKINIEVCCSNLPSAIAAYNSGADRIELCAALEVGGTTPTPAFIEETISNVKIPVLALVRPRPGNFHYDTRERKLILNEIDQCLQAGCDGIVTGVLNSNNEIDHEFMVEVRDLVRDKDLVFSRAFDITNDLDRTTDQLIDIGIDRILTSGGQKTALEGLPQISSLIERSKNRIEIMPGSGISWQNALQIIDESKAHSIHLSCSTPSQKFSALFESTSYFDVEKFNKLKEVLNS